MFLIVQLYHSKTSKIYIIGLHCLQGLKSYKIRRILFKIEEDIYRGNYFTLEMPKFYITSQLFYIKRLLLEQLKNNQLLRYTFNHHVTK